MSLTNRLKGALPPHRKRDSILRGLSGFATVFLLGMGTSQTVKDGGSATGAALLVAALVAALWCYAEHRAQAALRTRQTVRYVYEVDPNTIAITDLDALFKKLGPPPLDIVTLHEKPRGDRDGEG